MSKNIGWTKKQAIAIAKRHNATHLAHQAYEQREDHYGSPTMQWIVVIQKKTKVEN